MASFKTAYLQREIVETCDVVGASPLKVGDYVKFTAATATVPAYIQKSTIANATHIIAQSDMTMEYGHVPVENRDYRYKKDVACTQAAAPTKATTTQKKVALFKITDPNDVIPDADGSDHA